MIAETTHDTYTATIGIECHVQLKTKTKLFAAVNNDAREAPPNTLVSHICFGLPGALPVLNEAAVELAARAAFALGTTPQRFSKFDRKHYFYPDLPKGYQITQYDEPVILGGSVAIELADGTKKTINITRVHMEEDAGKSVHPAGKDYSLVDLNRAGTPLLEVVSEPEMHSAAEAKAFARELFLRMKYAGVSDANLYYGNMRFDVNVSVSKTNKLGTRSETKNLNSFRSVEKAVDYEIARQTALLEKGQPIVQETRGWDDAKQKTVTQRTKENADDYRYFADPDIPPIVMDDKFINKIRSEMPIMPSEWRQRLAQLGLDKSHIETLLEAEIDDAEVSYLPLLEMNLDKPREAKFLANWFVNVEIPLRRTGKMTNNLKDGERVAMYLAVFALIEDNKLSSTGAKTLLANLLESDNVPKDVEEYAESLGLIQVSDESELTRIVAQVLQEQPQAVADIAHGEMKAMGFLVGQVMKLSKGKANPQIAQTLIKKQLPK